MSKMMAGYDGGGGYAVDVDSSESERVERLDQVELLSLRYREFFQDFFLAGVIGAERRSPDAGARLVGNYANLDVLPFVSESEDVFKQLFHPFIEMLPLRASEQRALTEWREGSVEPILLSDKTQRALTQYVDVLGTDESGVYQEQAKFVLTGFEELHKATLLSIYAQRGMLTPDVVEKSLAYNESFTQFLTRRLEFFVHAFPPMSANPCSPALRQALAYYGVNEKEALSELLYFMYCYQQDGGDDVLGFTAYLTDFSEKNPEWTQLAVLLEKSGEAIQEAIKAGHYNKAFEVVASYGIAAELNPTVVTTEQWLQQVGDCAAADFVKGKELVALQEALVVGYGMESSSVLEQLVSAIVEGGSPFTGASIHALPIALPYLVREVYNADSPLTTAHLAEQLRQYLLGSQNPKESFAVLMHYAKRPYMRTQRGVADRQQLHDLNYDLVFKIMASEPAIADLIGDEELQQLDDVDPLIGRARKAYMISFIIRVAQLDAESACHFSTFMDGVSKISDAGKLAQRVIDELVVKAQPCVPLFLQQLQRPEFRHFLLGSHKVLPIIFLALYKQHAADQMALNELLTHWIGFDQKFRQRRLSILFQCLECVAADAEDRGLAAHIFRVALQADMSSVEGLFCEDETRRRSVHGHLVRQHVAALQSLMDSEELFEQMSHQFQLARVLDAISNSEERTQQLVTKLEGLVACYGNGEADFGTSALEMLTLARVLGKQEIVIKLFNRRLSNIFNSDPEGLGERLSALQVLARALDRDEWVALTNHEDRVRQEIALFVQEELSDEAVVSRPVAAEFAIEDGFIGSALNIKEVDDASFNEQLGLSIFARPDFRAAAHTKVDEALEPLDIELEHAKRETCNMVAATIAVSFLLAPVGLCVFLPVLFFVTKIREAILQKQVDRLLRIRQKTAPIESILGMNGPRASRSSSAASVTFSGNLLVRRRPKVMSCSTQRALV